MKLEICEPWLPSQRLFIKRSYAKQHFEKTFCRNCTFSVILTSQCPHCADWKKGLCCHQCAKETDATFVRRRAGYLVQLSTIYTTIPVCLFVLCYSAIIDCTPSPPAGSAMSGLDGLIGAEEKIINIKPRISSNVVRSLTSLLSFCLCREAILTFQLH